LEREHLNESTQARNWRQEAGDRSQEPGGKSQKSGARSSIFTNMREMLPIGTATANPVLVRGEKDIQQAIITLGRRRSRARKDKI